MMHWTKEISTKNCIFGRIPNKLAERVRRETGINIKDIIVPFRLRKYVKSFCTHMETVRMNRCEDREQLREKISFKFQK